MSKTPGELAMEFVKSEIHPDDAARCFALIQKGFLAGYQAAKPQWISVKERLPEEDKWILGYYSRFKSKEQFVVGLVKRFIYSWAGANIWITDIQEDAISYEEVYSITHWQPLPEPPKEEK